MHVDFLGERYYGDPELEWVIALRNDLDLPEQELYRGMELKIPSPDYVFSKIVGA